MVKEGYSREVIQVSDLKESNIYATKKTVIGAALIPIAVSVPLIYKKMTESYTTTSIPVTATVEPTIPLSLTEPTLNVFAQSPTLLTSPEMIPTGFIADSSLEMLANVLDPLIQIMVAISFPIASCIMVGGSFFFMLGNSEKAWQTIFNAGLGYVIIQMSPLFLQILRQVGEAV